MTTSKLPKVQLTNVFRQALIADGLDPDDFAQYFAEWKEDWPKYELADFYFGKDGDYKRPLRHGKRVLRHVHLAPLDDSPDYADWCLKAKRLSRKTSDEILVYAQDQTHGFLLLHIAREPTGHELGEMATPTTHQLMNDLADVAEAFIHDGSVII